MTSYYGAHVDVQGSPLLFFILACILAHIRWLDTHNKLWLFPSLIFFGLGVLTDWFALYLCFLFPLYHRLRFNEPGITLFVALKKNVSFILLGCFLFIVLVVWLGTAETPQTGTTLWESLVVRTVKPFLFVGQDFALEEMKQRFIKYSIPYVHDLYPWPFLALIALGFLLSRIQPNPPTPLPPIGHRYWFSFFF